VDDNPLVRQAVCELFTREGDFDVCGEAENGREAIEKAQLLRPNLIVTDLSMPVMNGLEETQKTGIASKDRYAGTDQACIG
jgi:two-component system chemotaxis response regulator CheB